MGNQYPLDLSPNPVFKFDNFVEGQSNRDAFRAIKAFPDWPAPVFTLSGPAGCGKTHLGSAWQNKFQNVAFVDQATEQSEEHLFTIINRALNGEVDGVLLADRLPTQAWNIKLPDLRSRLDYIPDIAMEEPGDDILEPIARKLFEDRGREIKAETVAYILKHYERTVPAIAAFIEQVDKAASASKRDVSRSFVASLLKKNRT